MYLRPNHRFFKAMLPLLTLIFAPQLLWAQMSNSDTTLSLNQFGLNDLVERKPKAQNKVYAANRLPENADNLPVKTYVIDRDEIIANGYSTIVDVLKTLPGFRVSQPGSAMLGETFVMRGLLGNSYCKILINGQSVVPTGAPGMPLGGQLPIKQAERIEIILGPASSLYGADAMAGVINIVMPEVERPVEAMASATLGSGGLNEMHIGLGGKVGKDNHIIQYNLYGTSRQIEDLPFNYDDEVWDVDSSDLENPLFRTDAEGFAIIGDIPHESRLLGGQIQYGGLKASTQFMYRSDHSALGSAPSEISYAESDFYFAEFISNYALSFEKQLPKNWWIQSTASWLNYEMDDNSTYEGISHPLSNGRNYMWAASDDIQGEQLVGYSYKRFNFLFGGSYQLSWGDAFVGYLERRFNPAQLDTVPGTTDQFMIDFADDSLSLVADQDRFNTYEQSNIAGFFQGYYRGEKLSVIAALRYDHPNFIDGQTSPKLGVFYRATDKLRLRAFYGAGWRQPAAYYRHNNYIAGTGPPTTGPPSGPTYINSDQIQLQAETFNSIEGRAIYDLDKNWRVQVQIFRHNLNNSIFPVLEYPDVDSLLNWMPGPPGTVQGRGGVGFTNAESFSELRALQLGIQYQNERWFISVDGQWSRGEEKFDLVEDIDSYRNVPEFMGSAKIQGSFGAGFNVALLSQFATGFTSAIFAESNQTAESFDVDGYYNIDIVIGKKFADNFNATLRINNLTESRNKGIFSNHLTSYEFDYIPQYARTINLGLTYSLN